MNIFLYLMNMDITDHTLIFEQNKVYCDSSISYFIHFICVFAILQFFWL